MDITQPVYFELKVKIKYQPFGWEWWGTQAGVEACVHYIMHAHLPGEQQVGCTCKSKCEI